MTSAAIVIEPIVTLGAYLKEQAAAQQRLPIPLRKSVPTYKELAEHTGVDAMTIYRLTAEHLLLQLPLDLGHRIVTVMRGLGFEMGVRDLVTWEVPIGLRRPPQGWEVHIEVMAPERLAVTLGVCIEQCRRVGEPRLPSVTDLAIAAQLSRRQLTRILSDKVQRLDLDKVGDVLTILAQAGWGLMPEDVLYYPQGDTTSLP